MSHSLTRRALLLAALAAGSGACRANKPQETAAPTSTSATSASAAQTSVPKLETVTITDMPESERGGTAVVLLHGWGARGDDLVSLAQRLSRPKSRFFVPAAPLPKGANGRAWFHLDTADRPAHAWEDETRAGYAPHAEVLQARRAVQDLLRDVRARYSPQRLVLAGFSQGAMLSLDVALAAEPPVDRVAALSGVLLVESLEGLRAPRTQRPAVLISHGRADPILPFHGAERAQELLSKHGFAVTFHPFDGVHEIPPDVVQALSAFIFAG